MDHLATLNSLAQRFQLRTLFPGSSLEPDLILEPPPDALDPLGLALSDTVQQVARIPVPVDIDLAFLGKWVRTLLPDLPPEPSQEDPIGGMPIVPQILGPLGNLTAALPPSTLMMSETGQAATAGVPEVLGRIKGRITQTVERLTDQVVRLPISVALRWQILDESTPGASGPPTGVSYSTDSGVTWTALPATLEVPSGGAPATGVATSLRLRFPVRFTELTTGIPDVMRFSVFVSLRLGLTPPVGAPVTTGWIDLPPVPLVIPTIPVPTILVLCEHRNFAGRKLVLVPSNSILGTAAIGIGPALDLTRSALLSFQSANALIGFLGTAAGPAGIAASVLKSLASSPGQVIIAAQSRVDDLGGNQFVFDPGGWFGIGRFTGDNMARSIICVGRPGTVFDFFHDTGLSERITRLQVTLDGRLGCALRQLEVLDPNVVIGESIFYTAPERPAEVYGGTVTSFSPRNSHEDAITSLSFEGPAVRFQP